MKNKLFMLAFAFIFIFGWFCSSAYSNVVSQISFSYPSSASVETAAGEKASSSFFGNKERDSPSDWIKQEQIEVYGDKVILQIEDPQWAVFTDTNSMDPLIDENSHAIQISPKSPESIKIGDIISYESDQFDGIVIHRVIDLGMDEKGWYCRAKGDNNPFEDPGRIRFQQIKRVLVAVIY